MMVDHDAFAATSFGRAWIIPLRANRAPPKAPMKMESVRMFLVSSPYDSRTISVTYLRTAWFLATPPVKVNSFRTPPDRASRDMARCTIALC